MHQQNSNLFYFSPTTLSVNHSINHYNCDSLGPITLVYINMSLDYIYLVFTLHTILHTISTNMCSISSPSQGKPSCYKMDIRKIIIILTLIQTIRMEIEPCANSMWTESIINNCYTGQMEKTEGCVRLSLQMMLENCTHSQVIVSVSPVNQNNWKCDET